MDLSIPDITGGFKTAPTMNVYIITNSSADLFYADRKAEKK